MPKTCRFIKYVQLNDCSKLLHFIGKFYQLSCWVFKQPSEISDTASPWQEKVCYTGTWVHEPEWQTRDTRRAVGPSLCGRCLQLLLVWTGVQWKWCWETWKYRHVTVIVPWLISKEHQLFWPQLENRCTNIYMFVMCVCMHVLMSVFCMYVCMYISVCMQACA